MDVKGLYEVIAKRKSVRKYSLEPLDHRMLGKVEAYAEGLQPLDKDIKVEIKFLSQKEVKLVLFPIKAPHYMVAFSEEKEGYLANVGFMLQQMDLFLSANSLGSCWLGVAKPTKEILKKSKLKSVVILAFGKADEKLHRDSISEFKRKPLEKITDHFKRKDLIEAAQLAPSSTNSQPWFFTGSENIIHAYCIKTSGIKALIYKKLNKIDMGIGICHIWIAAQKQGYTPVIFYDSEAVSCAPAGYSYMNSIALTQV